MFKGHIFTYRRFFHNLFSGRTAKSIAARPDGIHKKGAPRPHGASRGTLHTLLPDADADASHRDSSARSITVIAVRRVSVRITIRRIPIAVAGVVRLVAAVVIRSVVRSVVRPIIRSIVRSRTVIVTAAVPLN